MMKVIMLGGILDIDEWNHSVVVRNKTEKTPRRFGVFDSFPKIAKRERAFISASARYLISRSCSAILKDICCVHITSIIYYYFVIILFLSIKNISHDYTIYIYYLIFYNLSIHKHNRHFQTVRMGNVCVCVCVYMGGCECVYVPACVC